MTEAPVPGRGGSAPVPRFELTAWRDQFGVVAGITGRGAGVPFDLGLSDTQPPAVRMPDHWQGFRESLPEFSGIVLSRQIHGALVQWHEPAQGLVIQNGADGHATGSPAVLLAVTVADCIPIYFLDPVRRLAALVHAGWRGVAAGILGEAVRLLQVHGALVDNLLMHCGVGICGECYEVGSEVYVQCGLTPPAAGRGRLDLRDLLSVQALEKGVVHISTSQFCSGHDRKLFLSHRASRGSDGRMVAYLGFLP